MNSFRSTILIVLMTMMAGHLVAAQPASQLSRLQRNLSTNFQMDELAPTLPVSRPTLSAKAQPTALDGPIDPTEYILGPGDYLGLMFYNVARTRYDLIVEPDGAVDLQSLGRFQVAGMSLAEFETRHTGTLCHTHAADSLTLWVTQPRSIRVWVGGLIEEPQTLEMSYLSRVGDVLGQIHLLTPEGEETSRDSQVSLRRVRVMHQQDTTFVDLGSFYRAGNLKDNPLLEAGDRVIFDRRGFSVRAYGPFRQGDGEMEWVPGDTPASLVAYMGGIVDNAEGGEFELVREDSAGSIIFQERFRDTDAAYSELQVEPRDRLFYYAPDLPGRTIRFGEVYLYGAVDHPGWYPLDAGQSLGSVLDRAKPSVDADLFALRVYRQQELEPEIEYYNQIDARTMMDYYERGYLKARLLSDGGKVVLNEAELRQQILRSGDRILIPAYTNDVELVGGVIREGHQMWHEGWSIRDYVKAAGGKSKGTWLSRVRVRQRGEDAFAVMSPRYQPKPGDIIYLPMQEPMTPYQYFKEGLTIATQVLTVYLIVSGN